MRHFVWFSNNEEKLCRIFFFLSGSSLFFQEEAHIMDTKEPNDYSFMNNSKVSSNWSLTVWVLIFSATKSKMMLSILKFSFWTVFSPYSALQQNSQSIEIRQIDRNKFFDKIGHPFPKICYYITLLENLKFCPKISVSRKNDKIVNLNFPAKN